MCQQLSLKQQLCSVSGRYYARITLISDLENEAENANRSSHYTLLSACQHNGNGLDYRAKL